MTSGDQVLSEGEWISLNGTTGEVIVGKQPLAPAAISGDLGEFMAWVDDFRAIKVVIDTARLSHKLDNLRSLLAVTKHL